MPTLNNTPIVSDVEQKTSRSGPRLLIGRFLFLALTVGAAYLVTMFAIAPLAYQLNGHFTYSAQILSLDNFYDESAERFLGEARSVTSFSYEFVERQGQRSIVENTFDVRTVGGDQIVRIVRQYAILPKLWAHDPSGGDRSRSGYLFAPRWLREGQSFNYWHVNYNQPLALRFDGVERVRGLKTYRYTAAFQEDQTESLTHLPGVPEERGVSLDVGITLWFEPVSGWLVKYEDAAIAYYYDQATGERTNPWNAFQNRYRRISVDQQVEHARRLRTGLLALKWLVPFGVVLLLWPFMTRGQSRLIRRLPPIVLLVGAGLIFFAFTRSAAVYDPVIVGISRWVPVGNQAYEENISAFKQALQDAGYVEGRDVEYIDRTAQGQPEVQEYVVQEFLERDVDLVYSLTTPGTASLKERITNRPIVFSVVTYPVQAGLVASLERSENNLVGTRNWVPARDQLAVFLEIVPETRRIAFLHREGEVNSQIQLEEMREASQLHGVEIIDVTGVDVTSLIERLSEQDIDAIYSACDTLIQSEAESAIVAYASQKRIPSFSCNSSGPGVGDLVGTVADLGQIGKLAGEQAVLILDGATPSSLQTGSAVRSDIYVNQETAERLNIEVPQSILVKVKALLP